MIVPGEASESEDDDRLPSQPPEEQAATAVATPSTSSSLAPLAPSSWGQRMSSGLGRLGASLSSAAAPAETGLDAAELADVAKNAAAAPKSLLHAKLYEKNASLHKNLRQFVEQEVNSAPRDAARLVAGLARTQVYFQDTVLSMQQANHFCAELQESMDDFEQLAGRVKFPV